MKTDTINAVIGGEQARFRLEREPAIMLQFLEQRIGKPLFAVFRDVADGNWSTTTFSAILSAAHVGSPHRLSLAESTLVRKALTANPPGQYAPLVAKVLEAFLFGIDEQEATFTDELVTA